MKRIIAGLLLIIGVVWFLDTYACDPHFYFQAHAGKQGHWTGKSGDENWDGTKSIAAIFRAGYKHPVNDWLAIGAEAGHNSHWNKGEPFDDDGESYLDSATLFLELRI